MNSEIQKLQKIVAKAFRKAKKWYLGYIVCQFLILAFAIISIFCELNPNMSAVIAFVGVLAIETIRWRSDFWKSQAEFAKRKWEATDGLGSSIDYEYIADWLAAKSKNFLHDVFDDEVQGSLFESKQPKSPRRAVENTQESAWWSKHLSRKMVGYLSIALAVLAIAAFIVLFASIASLKVGDLHSQTRIQNIGGIICSVLMFVFSINAVRLLAEFLAFASDAENILRRCAELLKSGNISESEALSVMHDYQTARNSAPLLPTFIWKLHGNHLREQWDCFRPSKK